MDDGIHQLTRAEYDALERLNWSTLRHMARSAAHYRHAKAFPPRDTDAKRLGRAGHLAILEPEKFTREVVAYEGRRAGKDWDAFQAAHASKEILKADDYARCMSLSAAVRASPHARGFLSGGGSEVAVLWTCDGVPCKALVDYLPAAPGPMVDLKTTRDASPKAFGRQMHGMGVLGQAAWYVDAVAAVTGVARDFVLLAVENEAPHVVQPYEVAGVQLSQGRELYRSLLKRLKECERLNSWGGYAAGVLPLELPTWASGVDEDPFGFEEAA